MATSTSSVSGVGSISSAGIGSGLDVGSIVTQLMAVESRPLTLLRNQASSLQSEVSAYGSMKSLYSTLGDKVGAMLSPSLWSSTTATSDDTTSVQVSSASGAQTGSYAVSVDALATGQTLTSTAVSAASSALSEGTLTIALGSWSGGSPPAFTPKSGASAVSVTIGAADTSLAAIRDKINAAGAGVVASIITDASGARLSLRSKDTGAENAFRVTATETVDDGVAASGLSMLGYDPSIGASTMARAQAAGNASATINGIAIGSASNTLSNVVDGLTLTLNKVTTNPANVVVAADTASIKSAIGAFVSAYNGVAGFIHTQTAYNADAKTGGALQGDLGTLSLQSQLRGVINQPSSASAAFKTLSDIGITVGADGTLATSDAKLGAALNNLPELKKLLYTDGSDSASSGFIRRFERITDAALSIEGVFQSRSDGLTASLQRNSKAQDAMQNRLSAVESRLRAQYSALDTQMGKLNALSTYVSQQITLMNKSTN